MAELSQAKGSFGEGPGCLLDPAATAQEPANSLADDHPCTKQKKNNFVTYIYKVIAIPFFLLQNGRSGTSYLFFIALSEKLSFQMIKKLPTFVCR